MELQIAALKAQVKKLADQPRREILGDLYGILRGKADSTEEDIKAAEYRLKWEGDDPKGRQQ